MRVSSAGGKPHRCSRSRSSPSPGDPTAVALVALTESEKAGHFALFEIDASTGEEPVINPDLGPIPIANQPIRGLSFVPEQGFLTSLASARSDIWLLEGFQPPDRPVVVAFWPVSGETPRNPHISRPIRRYYASGFTHWFPRRLVMKRGSLLLFVVALLLVDMGPLAACGDKFLGAGRGPRFSKVYAAIYPGRLLMYAPAKGELAEMYGLDKALKRAGHQVMIAKDLPTFTKALQDRAVDIVLVDTHI